MFFNVFIGYNDIYIICFDLKKKNPQIEIVQTNYVFSSSLFFRINGFPLYKIDDITSTYILVHTINNSSQRVPVPLRNTSSGTNGIILQSEKMKG